MKYFFAILALIFAGLCWMMAAEITALQDETIRLKARGEHPAVRLIEKSGLYWRLFFKSGNQDCTFGPTRPDGELKGECWLSSPDSDSPNKPLPNRDNDKKNPIRI